MHRAGYIESFATWEAALLGWAGGRAVLGIGNSLYVRAAYIRSSGRADQTQDADDEYDKVLLRPFGVKLEEKGNSNTWIYPVLSLVPAVAIYFIWGW